MKFLPLAAFIICTEPSAGYWPYTDSGVASREWRTTEPAAASAVMLPVMFSWKPRLAAGSVSIHVSLAAPALIPVAEMAAVAGPLDTT